MSASTSAPTPPHELPPILVLVHPGSACGSANYNLGRTEARCARESLVHCLDDHAGGLIVIDGDFSDELPDYPDLNQAIHKAIQRATDAGQVALRVMGDDGQDFNQTRAIASVLEAHPDLKSHPFIVTGAWYEAPTPDDTEPGGCVGSVLTALATLGVRAHVDESAVEIEVA